MIGRFTCGFVLLTELVPERYQTFVGTALMCGDSAATLYLTFYYRFISKKSYAIFWVGLFLNILTFITTLFVPESVKWLISVKQYRRAKEGLYRIAKFNGITDFQMNSFKKEEEERV